MVITYEEAKKLVNPNFGMDPKFPKDGVDIPEENAEQHIKYMLHVVWPFLKISRSVLVSQKQMPSYTALGLFGVGDRDLGYLGAGHVSYVDYPGKGKTLFAKIPALVFGGTHSRFQGIPDALPSDYTGNRIIQIDKETGERYFDFVKGPAQADIQLHDEFNRNNPRLHAGVLERISEGTITVAGKTYGKQDGLRPCFVIFTRNPIESEGTYPISDALKDRMMFEILGDRFLANDFAEILERTDEYDSLELPRVCDFEKVLEIRRFFHKTIYVSPQVRAFIGGVCERLNAPHRFDLLKDLETQFGGHIIEVAISGRGVVHLEGAARALAAFRYRGHVVPDDVYKVLLPILRHRVRFTPAVLTSFKDKWGHHHTLITGDRILKQLIREVW